MSDTELVCADCHGRAYRHFDRYGLDLCVPCLRYRSANPTDVTDYYGFDLLDSDVVRHLRLSPNDARRAHHLGTDGETALVTDVDTGVVWVTRRASCGFGCYCAAELWPAITDELVDVPAPTPRSEP